MTSGPKFSTLAIRDIFARVLLGADDVERKVVSINVIVWVNARRICFGATLGAT